MINGKYRVMTITVTWFPERNSHTYLIIYSALINVVSNLGKTYLTNELLYLE